MKVYFDSEEVEYKITAGQDDEVIFSGFNKHNNYDIFDPELIKDIIKESIGKDEL